LLELHVIDELTHAEIATRLNLNSATASRKRLQRLRSKLMDRLLGAIGHDHPRRGRAEEDER
jgi:DNA-directed RNA polymerase specialized sigma24 family protein